MAEQEARELKELRENMRNPVTRPSAEIDAGRRAQTEPEVVKRQNRHSAASAQIEQLRSRGRARRALRQRQLARQQRMAQDFEHALEVTYLVLDAEFIRARFEHRVNSEGHLRARWRLVSSSRRASSPCRRPCCR
mmetsp:Transcript_172593/g.548012  ORF Transcript_172593/g.548012 Transcript_172593/m.548012 type:complete len:135 (-) Transcript_172593:664-1068(-)